MSLKNTVAAERRMDLASLFCMIGRHGPAVALAVIAMVSVLAGFIIYRSVRGKRRKATAAAADGDGQSPGAERDAATVQASGYEESTDVSDEGSSGVKEDVNLIQSELKIRHRRAGAAAGVVAVAAEKKPPPYSPPKSDIPVPESKHTTSDDVEKMAVVQDSHKVAEMFEEEPDRGLQSDTYRVAEMVVEDAADFHQGATDDIVEDVIGAHGDSCLKEPESITDKNHEEKEKVSKAECWEDEDVSTDKDVSDQQNRQEEENFQHTLNNSVCFEQTPHMGEKDDDDRLKDNETTLETNNMDTNLEEPVIHIEDVPAPCICDGKDEELEEVSPDIIDCSSYAGHSSLPPEEERIIEGEEVEEDCVDNQVIAQQAEVWSSTSEQGTNWSSIQQDQCDHVMDTVTMPVRDSKWDEDEGLAGEVIEEAVNEDHLNKFTVVVKFDDHSPLFHEQEVDIEQTEENGLECKQENGADEVKEKMLTNDDFVACSEECDSSSVTLPCLSVPINVDDNDDGLSGVTEANDQISGIVDFPDMSSDCQEPQKEDNIAVCLDEDLDSIIPLPQMPPHETENQLESNANATTRVLAEECTDHVDDPHIQPCYKDQQSVKTMNDEIFDKPSVAADSDTVESITASVIVEEISSPQLPTICKDQPSDHMDNNETSDQMRVNSATDAPAWDDATITSPIMSGEMLSSPQDKQSDHTRNNEDFSEVTTGAAPVMTETISPMCQIHSLSFEQSSLRDNDISSPGVGDESGISSMAVSPVLQDVGNEFDVPIGNMVLPVMDCDLQSDGQTEAQNSLFVDDVAISVINEDTACMVFGPYPSRLSQPSHSECTDWTNYESFAANEDMFGHEIEDGYHRAMDHFAAQIAASVTTCTNELKIQTDMKAIVEVVEIKEQRSGVNIKKKEDPEAEEKEEEYEKTEISIMEATMDHNEWITESNYQVLPWLNLSAQSFAQDLTKTNQLHTEECQFSSVLTDTTSIDATDVASSTEGTQTSTLPLVDENTENNKKVVAVQPMPQNVSVTFRVHYFTQSPYQTVAVTGDQQELGNWKGFIPLERSKDGHWATVIRLPAESHVQWKFVVVDKGEVCRWEECGNRLLDTGSGDDLLVHKWWGLL